MDRITQAGEPTVLCDGVDSAAPQHEPRARKRIVKQDLPVAGIGLGDQPDEPARCGDAVLGLNAGATPPKYDVFGSSAPGQAYAQAEAIGRIDRTDGQVAASDPVQGPDAEFTTLKYSLFGSDAPGQTCVPDVPATESESPDRADKHPALSDRMWGPDSESSNRKYDLFGKDAPGQVYVPDGAAQLGDEPYDPKDDNAPVELHGEIVVRSSNGTDATGLGVIVNLPVDYIQVTGRHRRDPQDIAEMAASILECGLLSPIIVTADYTLVIGYRRLLAHRLLGLPTIAAIVKTDLSDIFTILKMEAMENSVRSKPAPSDLVALAEQMLPYAKEAAEHRRAYKSAPSIDVDVHLKRFTGVGNALDQVAALVGMSRPTLTKAAAIVKYGTEDPARFGLLVSEMDETGNIGRVYRKLRDLLLPEGEEEPEPRRCSVKIDKNGELQADHNLTVAQLVAMLRALADRLELAAAA